MAGTLAPEHPLPTAVDRFFNGIKRFSFNGYIFLTFVDINDAREKKKPKTQIKARQIPECPCWVIDGVCAVLYR